MSRYEDRRQAGRVLASALGDYAHRDDVLVLALPRGGVPVAFEVAEHIAAPLDVFVVRKLGVPGFEELAMGAIASGGVQVLNDDILSAIGISDEMLQRVVESEREELERRERAYRSGYPPLDVRGKTVILVDDGLATGFTMRAAIRSLRRRGPSRVVVAVPIAPPSTCEKIAAEVDDIVCAATPEPFDAVGLWYRDFSQTTDDEVRELLDASRRDRSERAEAPLRVSPRASEAHWRSPRRS
jgi:predicted phosphoribosyltransferase